MAENIWDGVIDNLNQYIFDNVQLPGNFRARLTRLGDVALANARRIVLEYVDETQNILDRIHVVRGHVQNELLRRANIEGGQASENNQDGNQDNNDENQGDEIQGNENMDVLPYNGGIPLNLNVCVVQDIHGNDIEFV